MISLFKPKSKKNYNLSWLVGDMHSHLLPGIDDGSPDVETSKVLISGLQELGLERFIATPHIYAEIHPNDRRTITAAQQQLNQALAADGGFGALQIDAAAEYMIDDSFRGYFEEQQPSQQPHQHPPMLLPQRQVLVEMSYQYERQDFYDQLFQLQLQGLTPVLAHPERYGYYHNEPKVYKRIKERGCRFQLNILSLSGYYGDGVRKMAQLLVKEGMIDYVGTDLHHPKHLAAIQTFVTTHDVQHMLKGNRILNETLFT